MRGSTSRGPILMELSAIYVYPIKSTAGVCVQQSTVQARGLDHDRRWALIDADGGVVTARNNPELLRLTTEIDAHELRVLENGERRISVPLAVADNAVQAPVLITDSKGTGVAAETAVNDWFSSYLGIPVRLMFMSPESHRTVASDAGGNADDEVSFADRSPLMILSEATLETLNSKLDAAIPMVQFRPNLVIRSCAPDAEDSWQRIRIGECEFELLNRVQRCVFATIDPDSQIPHSQQEPLRTLSTYRPHEDGGVAFGRHLVARQYGVISVGDRVEVLD